MKRLKSCLSRTGLEKYAANKYNYFFLSIILLIAAEPYIQEPRLPMVSFAFLLIMLTLLWALKLSKRLFRCCLVLAFIAAPLGFLTDSHSIALRGTAYFCSELISLCAYLLFLLIVLKVLLWKIFTEKKITGDTVRGGISIYFLMAIFWSFAYGLLLLFNPKAISFPGPSSNGSVLMYYSFVTMTTLGYGDIVPVSGAARSLSILEATLGQIFITVFIARLVGLSLKSADK